MPVKFKTGDVIVLKSGGPKMTVTGIHAPHGGTIHVDTAWFAGAKKEHGTFPQDTLELPAPPKSKSE